jgi:hypothetical protein
VSDLGGRLYLCCSSYNRTMCPICHMFGLLYLPALVASNVALECLQESVQDRIKRIVFDDGIRKLHQLYQSFISVADPRGSALNHHHFDQRCFVVGKVLVLVNVKESKQVASSLSSNSLLLPWRRTMMSCSSFFQQTKMPFLFYCNSKHAHVPLALLVLTRIVDPKTATNIVNSKVRPRGQCYCPG